MKALDRKLLRDLSRLKGQLVTIALVVAAGIAAFISLRGTYSSVLRARDTYYQAQRFAEVFARLERAPEAVAREIERIPGIARVETRVVNPVALPLPDAPRPIQGEVLSRVGPVSSVECALSTTGSRTAPVSHSSIPSTARHVAFGRFASRMRSRPTSQARWATRSVSNTR